MIRTECLPFFGTCLQSDTTCHPRVLLAGRQSNSGYLNDVRSCCLLYPVRWGISSPGSLSESRCGRNGFFPEAVANY
ncbi:hypothetical protein FHG87_000861 [Trinorchestia longiramus]|nr:hypothetical protein FHG87_000861 [Trinorchestia longiramus]